MRNTDTIIICKGKAGWYWRIKARNGKTLCHGASYTGKQGCKDTVLGLVSRHDGFKRGSGGVVACAR